MKRTSLIIGLSATLCLSQAVQARNAGFLISADDGVETFDKSKFKACGATSLYRYCLPRQVLDLTVTVSVYADDPKTVTPASPLSPTKVSIESPAKVSLISAPDPDLSFLVDYTHMRGLLTDIKSSDLTVSDAGCLTGMNAEFKDETATIVADALISAIKISKAIGTPFLAATYNTPKFTYDVHRIVRLDADYSGGVPMSNSSISSYTRMPKSMEKQGVHFDLDALGYGIKDEITQVVTTKGYTPPVASDMPAVSVWINQNVFSAKSEDLLGKTKYPGLIVRNPNVTELVVYEIDPFKQSVIADTVQLLAQTGSFTFVPMKRKFFSDFSTVLKVGGAGNASEINVKNDSLLFTILEALKAVTSAL